MTHSVPLIWPDVAEAPVLRANQFLTQIAQGRDGAPEDLLLSVGYYAPAVVLGTAVEQETCRAAMSAISVRTLLRVTMSRDRLDGLVRDLQACRSQWDLMSGHEPVR